MPTINKIKNFTKNLIFCHSKVSDVRILKYFLISSKWTWTRQFHTHLNMNDSTVSFQTKIKFRLKLSTEFTAVFFSHIHIFPRSLNLYKILSKHQNIIMMVQETYLLLKPNYLWAKNRKNYRTYNCILVFKNKWFLRKLLERGRHFDIT